MYLMNLLMSCQMSCCGVDGPAVATVDRALFADQVMVHTLVVSFHSAVTIEQILTRVTVGFDLLHDLQEKDQKRS